MIFRLVVNNGGGRWLINTAIGLCFDRSALQPLRVRRLFNTKSGVTQTSAVGYNPVPVKFPIRSRAVLLYVIMLWRMAVVVTRLGGQQQFEVSNCSCHALAIAAMSQHRHTLYKHH